MTESDIQKITDRIALKMSGIPPVMNLTRVTRWFNLDIRTTKGILSGCPMINNKYYSTEAILDHLRTKGCGIVDPDKLADEILEKAVHGG